MSTWHTLANSGTFRSPTYGTRASTNDTSSSMRSDAYPQSCKRRCEAYRKKRFTSSWSDAPSGRPWALSNNDLSRSMRSDLSKDPVPPLILPTVLGCNTSKGGTKGSLHRPLNGDRGGSRRRVTDTRESGTRNPTELL